MSGNTAELAGQSPLPGSVVPRMLGCRVKRIVMLRDIFLRLLQLVRDSFSDGWPFCGYCFRFKDENDNPCQDGMKTTATQQSHELPTVYLDGADSER